MIIYIDKEGKRHISKHVNDKFERLGYTIEKEKKKKKVVKDELLSDELGTNTDNNTEN